MKAIIIHAFLKCLFEVCELFKLLRHTLSALGFSICALKLNVPGGFRCQFASKRRITRFLAHGMALLSTMMLLFVYFSISENANKSGYEFTATYLPRTSVSNRTTKVTTTTTTTTTTTATTQTTTTTTTMAPFDYQSAVGNIKPEELLARGSNLMVVSYMRGGSSMNGQVFRDNEDDFYVYEPLIKYAPYQYLTENRFCQMNTVKCSKWVNRTKCERTDDTIEKIIQTLRNIYNCDIRHLEDSTLRNIMFENQRGLSKSGQSWFDFTRCYLTLNEPKGSNISQYFQSAKFTRSNKHPNILRHLTSTGLKAQIFKTCLENLETKCRTSKIRVTKVVRVSLRLVPRLLTQFSNLKIAYLFRDPRANLNSRIFTAWFPVNGSDVSTAENAIRSLCLQMSEDIKMVDRLKANFPARFIDVRLEDIVRRPVLSFESLFRSLNLELTSKHVRKVMNLYLARPNFESKWKHALKSDFVRLMEKECQSVFKFYDYEKVYS